MDAGEAGDNSLEVGFSACDTTSSAAVKVLSSTVWRINDSDDILHFCDVNDADVVSGNRTHKPVERYVPKGLSIAVKTTVRPSKLQPPKKFRTSSTEKTVLIC